MFATALLIGLLGSFHCVGMCGPIAFILPVDRQNLGKRSIQIFLYHFGRLTAYSLIGVVFGLIGKSLSIFGIQQYLSIVVGVLMILMVLIPVKTFNKYNLSKPIYKLISKVKTALGKELKKKSPDTFLTIGFLNGFLPCGLVYTALVGAIAMGTWGEGALYMMAFGLGTIPLMTTAIYLGNFLSGQIRKKITKLIPVFVVLIGVFFILRGLGLGIPYVSPAPVQELIEGEIECHE